jgi:hypothetical protein
MKSIVRKRLIALLSLAGFAGSGASGAAQVVKGSEPDKTTTEGKIKSTKVQQENKAAAGQQSVKSKKSGAAQYPIEHGKEASQTNNKGNANIKMNKNASESRAPQEAGRFKSSKVNSENKAAQAGVNKKNQGSQK